MKSLALHYLEVLGLRAFPGLINLAALMLLGEWLTPADYGIYSTAIATCGFLVSMLFGPLTFAIVPQHAKLEAQGRLTEYENSIVSLTFLISLVLAAIGILLSALGLVPWHYTAPAIALGMYTTLQEIPHARLQYWTYGGISLLQSLCLLGLTTLLVRPSRDLAFALHSFSLSYAVASVAALIMIGQRKLALPDFALLRRTLHIGLGYTFSTALENILYLGVRYTLLVLGTPQVLGIFSFCIDMAQRVIGVIVNIAGFAIIPVAFKNHAKGKAGEFGKTLITGAAMALVICLFAVIAIYLLRSLRWVPGLSSNLFDPTAFAIVSGAVVINRLKKILVDPFALKAVNPQAIIAGYAN
jgi:O-antigen/teichoic acid export membrane protein